MLQSRRSNSLQVSLNMPELTVLNEEYSLTATLTAANIRSLKPHNIHGMCVKTLLSIQRTALLLARRLALNEILMPVDRQYKFLKKYRTVNCPGSLARWKL